MQYINMDNWHCATIWSVLKKNLLSYKRGMYISYHYGKNLGTNTVYIHEERPLDIRKHYK